jgi:hypothetical protein
MLIKKANYNLVDVVEIDTATDSSVQSSVKSFLKTASATRKDSNGDFDAMIKAEIKKHPKSLFFKAKAIVADETNSNGDYFPKVELTKSAQTFVGVPFFTNHNNQDIENARGKIIWSEWNDDDNAIYVVGFVDREAYPHICRGIEEDYMTGVSMGAINGEALIKMRDGTEKPIADINDGDVVVTPYGNNCIVKKTHCDFLGKPMYSLDIMTYHRSPVFTEDHPVWNIPSLQVTEAKRESAIAASAHYHSYVKTGEKTGVGQTGWRYTSYEPKFTQASKLQDGDYVLVPSKYKLENGKSANSDFYYLLGVYMGDGYLQKNKKGEVSAISFCIGKDEFELASKLTTLIKKYSKALPSEVVAEDRNGLYITVWDRPLAQWINTNIGTGSRNKRIKFDVKFKDDAKNLLSGYLDTDGCIVDKRKQNIRGNKFGGFQFSSNNVGLLEDFQEMLISLGYVSRISRAERHPSLNSVVKVNTVEYTLSTGSNTSNTFNNSIKYSQSDFGTAEIKAGKSFITSINGNKYMACPIKSIDTIDNYKEPVYDITVENDECYIANGIAVHNCSVEYSLCSICKNRASTPDEYCNHIKHKKGRRFSGQAKDVVTGEIKTFTDSPVYEINYGIKFIELSGVADPACKTCHINNVFDNDSVLRKAASSATSSVNNILMYKESSMHKESSQAEIDQLNQTLKTLEDISVGLIQNRQQVDVEFASDLVKILSELQEFTDELVGAGYAQVQGAAPQQIPGTEIGDLMQQPVADPTLDPTLDQGLGTQPIGMEEAIPEGSAQSLGLDPTVTGSPTTPMVSSPQMPSSPVKPMANNVLEKIVKISDKINDIIQQGSSEQNEQNVEAASGQSIKESRQSSRQNSEQNSRQNSEQNLEQDEGDDLNMKRVPKVIEAEKAKIMTTLNKLLKETKESLEYNAKELTLNKNGGVNMTQKIASRVDAPDVVTEQQLKDQKGGYHPREGSPQHPRDEITQAQLADKRDGKEPDVITQEQLSGKRDGVEPDTITENQLVASRGGAQPDVITEEQLKGGYNVSDSKDVITEQQLEDKADDFWLRSVFSRKSTKAASDHVKDVIRVLAETAVQNSVTPDHVRSASKDLTASIKSKNAFLDNITKTASQLAQDQVDAGSRVKYWGDKGVKLASISKNELQEYITSRLNALVANDEKINPEMVLSVVEAVAEHDKSVEKISQEIDAIITSEASEQTNPSSRDEIRSLFDASDKSEDQKMQREAERKKIRQKIASDTKDNDISPEATHIIHTDMNEIGLDPDTVRNDKKTAKKIIAGFTRGSCISHNMALAGITNVNIDERGRVQIAISTEEGEDSVNVELPPATDDIMPNDIAPEGDITGEGLDMMSDVPATPDMGATTPDMGMPGTDTQLPPPVAASKKQMKRTAQIPGNRGGVGEGGMGAPVADVPNAPPDPMNTPVQSLTDQEFVDDETGLGEAEDPGQFPAGSKCPFCGSPDVNVGGKGREPGVCECQDCGAEYRMSVNVEVLNPEKMAFDDEGKSIPEPEEPELPAMPVAASMKLDKDTMVKLASLEKSRGLVCPACGQTECKQTTASSDDQDGVVKATCPACETTFTRELSVSVDEPSEGLVTVAWNIDPKKISTAGCKSCEEAARKFAAKVKIGRLLRKAANSEFPMANCMERIARKWGSNAVSTIGPCKGKPLAECVCKELERFGFTEIKKMNKLAEAMTQEDPMDQCLSDQVAKGYKQSQAEMICNAIRHKHASKIDSNIYAQAWSDEGFTDEDFDEMQDASDSAELDATDTPNEDLGDIGDALPELTDIEVDVDVPVEEETVTIEIPKEVAMDVKEQVEEAESVEIEISDEATEDIDVVMGEPPMGSAVELEVSETEIPEDKTEDESVEVDLEEVVTSKDKGNKMQREAKKLEQVKDVERETETTIPRADATIGKESVGNINVGTKEPSIPRGQATMGKESPSNIDKSMESPDVPTNDPYMGVEKDVQKGMPANKYKVKGTVIAQKTKTPEQIKNMEVKVKDMPRGDATMGQEDKDNVDVPAEEAKAPRGDATMGQEGKDNIDVDMVDATVPADDGDMGHEKDVQKDMPDNTIESLGTLKANEEKRNRQLERLAAARHQKACVVAARLLGDGRIKEEEMDDVISDLSKLEIDRIESFANRVYPKMTRSASSETLASPVIMESKGVEIPQTPSLQDELSDMFTTGSKQLHDALTGKAL